MLYCPLYCYSKCYFSSSEEYWQKQPPVVFCKKGVLTNFSKFTGKQQCQSVFFKRLYTGFSCEFAEICKITFFQNTFGRLLLHLEPCQIIYDRTFLWKYRSSSPGVLFEKVFLEISQNSQENTCASAFF